jgi:signal transduction histidine kinase
VAGASTQCRGDRECTAAISQLVTNLTDNAVKYTCTGAVSLTVWRVGAEAGITVSDTGPGIPTAELAQVFERFYRLDPARSASGGSGLGLAIAREIVHAHRGRIWAENNAENGCRFTFALPAVG